MYKVIAFLDGKITEEIFLTKEGADEYAFRLFAYDLASCPRIEKLC